LALFAKENRARKKGKKDEEDEEAEIESSEDEIDDPPKPLKKSQCERKNAERESAPKLQKKPETPKFIGTPFSIQDAEAMYLMHTGGSNHWGNPYSMYQSFPSAPVSFTHFH